jgi:tetratricopeptide (TPR) repeat protein
MPHVRSALALVIATATLALAQPAEQEERSRGQTPERAGLVVSEDQGTGYRGFDRQVMVDFGKAAQGDEAARQRMLEACDRAIKAEGDNAEAIAWRGAARMFEAGTASEAGDFMAAMNHVNAALADLNKARELEPANPGVRVVAARMLLNLAKNHPIESMAKSYATQGIEDASAGLESLHENWDKQPSEVKGELLLGVAQAYDALGKPTMARDWFNRVIGAVPGTAWAKQAQDWLDAADRRANSL